jgi:hypothetical protein
VGCAGSGASECRQSDREARRAPEAKQSFRDTGFRGEAPAPPRAQMLAPSAGGEENRPHAGALVSRGSAADEVGDACSVARVLAARKFGVLDRLSTSVGCVLITRTASTLAMCGSSTQPRSDTYLIDRAANTIAFSS